MLFIVCTYVGGVYVSTKVTTSILDVLGVHNELIATRKVFVTTSRTLNTMTECVNRSSLEYLAGAKLHFEADRKRIQKAIDANANALAKQRNATMACTLIVIVVCSTFHDQLTLCYARFQYVFDQFEEVGSNERKQLDAGLFLR